MTPRLTRPWRTLVPVLGLLACGPAPDVPPELVPLSTASFGGIAVHPAPLVIFTVTYSASEAVWIRPDVDAALPIWELRIATTTDALGRLLSLLHFQTLFMDDGENRSANAVIIVNPDPAAAVDWLGTIRLDHSTGFSGSNKPFVTWRGPDGLPAMARTTISSYPLALDHDLAWLVGDQRPITILSHEGAVHRCDFQAHSDPDFEPFPHDPPHWSSCAPVADPSQAPLPRVGVCVLRGEPWRSVLDRLEAANVQQLNELALMFNCDDQYFDGPTCDTTDSHALPQALAALDTPPSCAPSDDCGEPRFSLTD
jgi:hypothetical protein